MMLGTAAARAHIRDAEHEQQHGSAEQNAESYRLLAYRQGDDERHHYERQRQPNTFEVRGH